MKDKVWILTRSINDYKQDGEYFEAAFKEKPTAEDIKKHVKGLGDKKIGELLSEGCVDESSYTTYDLEEVELY